MPWFKGGGAPGVATAARRHYILLMKSSGVFDFYAEGIAIKKE